MPPDRLASKPVEEGTTHEAAQTRLWPRTLLIAGQLPFGHTPTQLSDGLLLSACQLPRRDEPFDRYRWACCLSFGRLHCKVFSTPSLTTNLPSQELNSDARR